MALSFEAKKPVECDRMATFADGLAVRVAIPEAVALVNGVVDRMLLVSEREMAHADRRASPRAGIRAEGAAASALAALPQLSDVDGPVVARRHGPQHRRRAPPARGRAPGIVPRRRESLSPGVDQVQPSRRNLGGRRCFVACS